MNRFVAVYTAVLIGATPLVGLGQVQKSDVPGIVNYSRVDATVACGGATEPSAFGGLKQEGFAAVVNLRASTETGANVDEERAAVESAGLKYFHIPWSATEPTPGPVETFLSVMADPGNSPVYIHCAGAGRAGAMMMIKRVLMDGWTVEKALAEAEAIGMERKTLKDFVLEYVKTHRKAG